MRTNVTQLSSFPVVLLPSCQGESYIRDTPATYPSCFQILHYMARRQPGKITGPPPDIAIWIETFVYVMITRLIRICRVLLLLSLFQRTPLEISRLEFSGPRILPSFRLRYPEAHYILAVIRRRRVWITFCIFPRSSLSLRRDAVQREN